MTYGEIMKMRYALLNYLFIFARYSLFIKEGLQRYNGSFVSIEKCTIPFGKVYFKIRLIFLLKSDNFD